MREIETILRRGSQEEGRVVAAHRDGSFVYVSVRLFFCFQKGFFFFNFF